jgi:hypothetical protein
MDRTRAIATAFAAVLLGVTALSYIPGLKDAQGLTFGLFKLNLFNDLLHTSSAVWAGISAYVSRRAAVTFLKLFGVLYFLDGLMGTMIGSGYLDLGVLINGVLDLPFKFKFLSSLPHLVLGGVAAYAGFVLDKRL